MCHKNVIYNAVGTCLLAVRCTAYFARIVRVAMHMHRDFSASCRCCSWLVGCQADALCQTMDQVAACYRQRPQPMHIVLDGSQKLHK